MTIYEGKLSKVTVLKLNKFDRRKARQNAIERAAHFRMKTHGGSRKSALAWAKINYDRYLADLRREKDRLVILA